MDWMKQKNDLVLLLDNCLKLVENNSFDKYLDEIKKADKEYFDILNKKRKKLKIILIMLFCSMIPIALLLWWLKFYR